MTTSRLRITAVAATLLFTACGGGTADTTAAPTTAAPATTTAAPATTAPATTTTPPVTAPAGSLGAPQSFGNSQLGRWASGLTPGTCFNDVWADDGITFDFDRAAEVVDCDDGFDNVTISLLLLADDPAAPYPADIEAASDAACMADWYAFTGRGYDDSTLFPFIVWPDENDWAAGDQFVVCAAYSSGQMIGSVATAGLTAPDEEIVYLSEVDVLDYWIINGDGTQRHNLTADEITETRARADWSPDGTRIVYAAEVEGNSDIYVINSDGSGMTRLTDDPGTDDSPVWSPDGERIAFISDRADGEFDIFTMAADGSDLQRVTVSPNRDTSPDWHPDGDSIAYRSVADGNSNIHVTNAAGGVTVNLTTDPAFEGDPTWSPDGEKILFTTDVTGDFEIFVMDADGANPANLTNHPADDEYPAWSSDGSFIAFHSDRQYGLRVFLMRADGSDQSVLTPDAPSGYPRFRP